MTTVCEVQQPLFFHCFILFINVIIYIYYFVGRIILYCTCSIYSVFLLIPLVTDPLYLACIAKISILKKGGIIEKISYER